MNSRFHRAKEIRRELDRDEAGPLSVVQLFSSKSSTFTEAGRKLKFFSSRNPTELRFHFNAFFDFIQDILSTSTTCIGLTKAVPWDRFFNLWKTAWIFMWEASLSSLYDFHRRRRSHLLLAGAEPSGFRKSVVQILGLFHVIYWITSSDYPLFLEFAFLFRRTVNKFYVSIYSLLLCSSHAIRPFLMAFYRRIFSTTDRILFWGSSWSSSPCSLQPKTFHRFNVFSWSFQQTYDVFGTLLVETSSSVNSCWSAERSEVPPPRRHIAAQRPL